ncbi:MULTISPECIES: 3-deoxy-manno-octulosonate cytidylyltransferase [Actibacterium]|uniref:3-deoxy-manno-octulosonate cytidylyltransferase (CMP-KDO synthetase) n=1 Tax=Actibacterium naphthalenivorans TaxID=1614693 RepID=A0A840CBW6_9RHOB|nr:MULTISPECIES: manno-octulosonate cytidylyltransferase [Actibacterium]ALG88916.1 3-deoxy-manno-octulosonate cytidylyltransferase [Actibacterium sp. EMB200-NS6]MBB4021562.1 3-deoxy-manno-octulosonate cytidylyltransferase (CMP-KDO synthetase) [Actibacterium naphthalenivorans]
MPVLIVIPARYASTRYPGKPLVGLKGANGLEKSLIQRSWEAACAVPGDPRVVVATDDDRIRLAAQTFGAEVVMTSESCANGTERCAEAYDALGGGFDIVVNLQGDAPLTPAWFVEELVAGLRADPVAEVATPVLRCDGQTLNALLEDRRAGRVGGTTAVFGQDRKALYFSKEVIPYTGRTYADDAETPVFHHVGVYAYRPSALAAYPRWAAGPLEQLEGLEQLRFLERERPVLCVEVAARGRQFWELNNPEDVPRIEAMLIGMGVE